MKKFSWIFALILALSLAFIGCPVADDDDDSGKKADDNRPVSVTGVTLNETSHSLNVGDTETLIATVLPTNATNKNVTWSSSDTAVATVSDGVITAVAPGEAVITVKTADGNKTAICTVVVRNPAWSDFAGNLTISPSTATVGTELTATYDGTESVTLIYQWKKGADNVGTNSNKFTPSTEGSYSVTISALSYNPLPSDAVVVTSGSSGPGGGAEDIHVTFGDGNDGTTEIFFDKGAASVGAAGTGPLADGSGYKYVYGQNYGNVIGRFKVDLGVHGLSSYGKVTFKFATEGYKDDGDNVSSNKKLYLLATDDEDEITADGQNAKQKAIMVSTDYFDTVYPTDNPDVYGSNPNDFYASKSPAPVANGNAVQKMELQILPIVRGDKNFGDLNGEVWFAIYVHANAGAFIVTDVTFVAGPYVAGETTNPGQNAPNKPVVVVPGAKPFDFEVDLDYASSHLVVNPASVNGSTSVADSGYVYAAGTGLTLTYTGGNMRAYIAFTDEQKELIRNRNRKEVTIELTATAANSDNSANTENFRYMIGHGLAGGSWNGTDDFGSATIDSDSKKNQKFNSNADKDTDGAPDRISQVILNYQGSTATTEAPVTVVVTKIRVYTTPLAVAFTADSTDEVLARQGTVSAVTANGFTFTSVGDNYERAWAYFEATLGAGYKLSDYKKISYTVSISSTYKGIFIDAFASEDDIDAIPADGSDASKLPVANNIINTPSGDYWAASGGGGTANTATPHTLELVADLPEGTDLNKVWLAIRTDGDTGVSFTITDIKFY